MTKSQTNEDRMGYYAQARSWAEDRQISLKRSRTLAWALAGVAVAIAALEAVALASLAPLKSVEPYTILVDRQTGYTQILKGDGAERITADDALIQSMLAQYVVARERYDITTIAHDYRKVALWSVDRARTAYMAAMQTGSADNPTTRLPRTSVINTFIKSVSRLGPMTALVRFDTERVDQGQANGARQSWIAVVRYRFARAPMSFDDRLINPLGFQVATYRKDQESPQPGDTDPAKLQNPAKSTAEQTRQQSAVTQ